MLRLKRYVARPKEDVDRRPHARRPLGNIGAKTAERNRQLPDVERVRIGHPAIRLAEVMVDHMERLPHEVWGHSVPQHDVAILFELRDILRGQHRRVDRQFWQSRCRCAEPWREHRRFASKSSIAGGVQCQEGVVPDVFQRRATVDRSCHLPLGPLTTATGPAELALSVAREVAIVGLEQHYALPFVADPHWKRERRTAVDGAQPHLLPIVRQHQLVAVWPRRAGRSCPGHGKQWLWLLRRSKFA
mmetsp:Transcript_104103/g.293569  ORF Transcript_104103/g.293569 Transcript_104103/m.293569 type:complete len:245 (-) Transcript_104103:369-1103(-)